MEAVSLRRIPDNPYNSPAITHLTRTRQTKTHTLEPGYLLGRQSVPVGFLRGEISPFRFWKPPYPDS